MSKFKKRASLAALGAVGGLVDVASSGMGNVSERFNKLRDKRLCLGITGLSQSGKSTFITSLINQLAQHETASLPGFSPVLSERLLGVTIHPLEDDSLAEFPYDVSYQGLASAEPTWPASTDDTSGCLLELKLTQATSRLNPFSREHYSLYLEIRDYPGEWLLDLPLRDMTYSRWCAQCSAQYTQEPRVELLGDFLGELQHLDPLGDADEDRLEALSIRFKEFLHSCKYDGNSLSQIQPGRFLVPGSVEDSDLLTFIPLLKCGSYTEGQLKAASKGSYFKVCEQRYKRYIAELVDPFYKQFFSRIDRQLVLVDIVNAINAGPDYLDDMRQALANITDSFAYGSQSLLGKLFSSKIDKVVFAATKVDQLVSEDHDAVRQLLALVIKQAYRSAQHEGVLPLCEATAAVRSSKEIRKDDSYGISGTGEDGKPIAYIHPKIPARIPVGEEWVPFLEWSIPQLRPPKGVSYENHDAIPHIRLDTVLNALIEDKCR